MQIGHAGDSLRSVPRHRIFSPSSSFIIIIIIINSLIFDSSATLGPGCWRNGFATPSWRRTPAPTTRLSLSSASVCTIFFPSLLVLFFCQSLSTESRNSKHACHPVVPLVHETMTPLFPQPCSLTHWLTHSKTCTGHPSDWSQARARMTLLLLHSRHRCGTLGCIYYCTSTLHTQQAWWSLLYVVCVCVCVCVCLFVWWCVCLFLWCVYVCTCVCMMCVTVCVYVCVYNMYACACTYVYALSSYIVCARVYMCFMLYAWAYTSSLRVNICMSVYACLHWCHSLHACVFLALFGCVLCVCDCLCAVWLSVSMRVCMSVCLWDCVCLFVIVCVCLRVSICICVCIYLFVIVFVSVCFCMPEGLCVPDCVVSVRLWDCDNDASLLQSIYFP